MRALPLAMCLWPGLPRLWWRGGWGPLAGAVLFAAALNLLLVSTFLWPELLPAGGVNVGWLALVAVWGYCAIRSYRSFPVFCSERVALERDLLIEAQHEYLLRHWAEAELLLQRVTGCAPHDTEAQLMLATLYRRQGRTPEALARLEVAKRADATRRWQWEIEHERRLLARASASAGQGETLPPA